jgi:aspartate--tRNA ligase
MAESMVGLKRSHRCTEVSSADIGKKVTVMGWVAKRRNLGSLIFVDLRDRSGILQILFDENIIGKEGFDKAYTLRNEFVIAVEGEVIKRSGAVNENLKTGDIEIAAKTLRILSESETPPFPIEENIQTKEDIRLKYRCLDLRRHDIQSNIIMRSKVATLTRAFLANEGFLEIETPMLTKSTPEGARDYLVPSRIHPGKFYALPQSPQLFKQMLMCSGYDRYMQIARCFRDEDLRADRQPEFTQIDMELSFVDVDDVIDVNERLLAYLFKEVLDVDVKLPIQRMTWQEAMDRFGSDKPDLRFGMELQNVSDIVKDCGFGVFTGALENGGSVRGINAKGQGSMPRKKIDALVDFAKGYGAKGLAYIAIHEDGSYKSSFAKFMTEDQMNALVKAMDGEAGDLLLFAADRNKIVWNVLGALRVELADQMGLLDKSDYKFLWVTEFPQFEWSDEEERYVAMHHPFTMPMDEDLDMLETNPGAVRAKAYDIVLNGTEIGGGSVRIHQADVQSRMFKALGLTDEVANEKFGFLLDAFKYGVPPHAGLAYGLDRLVMLMAKRDSIRDVIAFPKVKDASCLLTNAPDVVDAKQLDELSIKIEEEKTEE